MWFGHNFDDVPSDVSVVVVQIVPGVGRCAADRAEILQSIFGTGTIFQLPRSTIFGFFDLEPERNYYFLVLTLLVLTILGVSRLRATATRWRLVALTFSAPCTRS